MKYLLHFLSLTITLSLAAHEVLPEVISGTDSVVGDTTHADVRCVATEHHGLVTFDFTVTGSLTEELHPFLKLNQPDRHLLTTAVGVFPKGRDGKEVMFGVTMASEFVQDSYLDIHTKDEYLRLHFEAVPVRKRQQASDGNAEKPLGVDREP